MSAASINNVIGKRFIELLSVDSTNNYAMRLVQNGEAKHGDAFFAFEQTAGRGQFDKKWLSEKGENIILSIVLNTSELHMHQQPSLGMIAALSVQRLFNNFTDEEIKIKWPNDIYCRDRKAAGILIENIVRGQQWQFAVAGFGINVNQTLFPADLKNPVSLKLITEQNFDCVLLAKQLCNIFEHYLYQLYSGNDAEILNSYNAALYKQNEVSKFKQGSRIFSGVIRHVDAYGKIIIDNGIEQAFETGQLELVL